METQLTVTTLMSGEVVDIVCEYCVIVADLPVPGGPQMYRMPSEPSTNVPMAASSFSRPTMPAAALLRRIDFTGEYGDRPQELVEDVDDKEDILL